MATFWSTVKLTSWMAPAASVSPVIWAAAVFFSEESLTPPVRKSSESKSREAVWDIGKCARKNARKSAGKEAQIKGTGAAVLFNFNIILFCARRPLDLLACSTGKRNA